MSVQILIGDARQVLATLPAESVQACVTSPPYFGLRDYGTARWEGGTDPACDHVVGAIRTGAGMAKLGARYSGGGHKAAEPKPMTAKGKCPRCGAVRCDNQIGLEATPDEYVDQMVALFREVRRVLRDDGTVWLNLGDSYATAGGAGMQGKNGQRADQTYTAERLPAKGVGGGVKAKDLLGIPWMVAFALRADGWYLRSATVWEKPNPMPESCGDRPTSSYEMVFLLAKRAQYFYDADAIREQAVGTTPHDLTGPGYSAPGQTPQTGSRAKGNSKTFRGGGAYVAGRTFDNSAQVPRESHGNTPNPTSDRNARNVWRIATTGFGEAHFATFPPALPERCILASTSAHGACTACGAPYARVIEKGEPDLEHQRACGGDAAGEYHGASTKGHSAAGVQDASAVKARILAGMVAKRTTGWAPTCGCQGASVRPCVVLDPFGGAGTTGLVADRHGRDAVLIELNPEYAAMAQRRIVAEAPLLAQVTAA